MPTLRLMNKAIEAAVSARYPPRRRKHIFCQLRSDISQKIPFTTYKPRQGKNDGDFRDFFKFPFNPYSPKKMKTAKHSSNFFQIPSTERIGFCQPHFPFSWLNTDNFSKRQMKPKLFSKKRAALRRKTGAKKQETLLLISCSVCRPLRRLFSFHIRRRFL